MTYEVTDEYRAAQAALFKAQSAARPAAEAVRKAKDDLAIAWYGKKIRRRMYRYNATQACALYSASHGPNSPEGFQAAMRAIAAASRAHAIYADALAHLHAERCKDQARFNCIAHSERKKYELAASHKKAIAAESAAYQRWQMLQAAAQSARAGKPVNL